MTLAAFVEWGGTLFGMLGAAMLALRFRYSKYGWVAFMISNVFWIAFGLLFTFKGFTTQQVFFVFTSGLGIFRWIILPARKKEYADA